MLFLLVTAALCGGPTKADITDVVVRGLPNFKNGYHVPMTARELPTLYQELGESLASLTVEVHATVDPARLRVIRTVTGSVTVMAEGPHVDLLGVADKSYPPLIAPRVKGPGLRFVLPKISRVETAPFAFDRAKVMAALRARKLKRWASLLEDGEATVGTAPSSVLVEVQLKERGIWVTKRSFTVTIPMGC